MAEIPILVCAESSMLTSKRGLDMGPKFPVVHIRNETDNVLRAWRTPDMVCVIIGMQVPW